MKEKDGGGVGGSSYFSEIQMYSKVNSKQINQTQDVVSVVKGGKHMLSDFKIKSEIFPRLKNDCFYICILF